MNRRHALILALGTGLIASSGPGTLAGSITSPASFATGNVGVDLPNTPGSGVAVIPGSPQTAVPQANWISQAGWINGWNIKDMRFSYNAQTDQLLVGVNTYGIAGNASGNGNPNVTDPRLAAAGGVDLPDLGGRKSISVAFASDVSATNHNLGTPVIVAGVPEYKINAGSGIDGFTVSAYNPNGGIQTSYGTQLPANNGGLAFNPSAAHPGFEFTVNNFSKIPGLDPKSGFWVQAYAGSPDDVVAGEDTIGWVRVAALAKQTVPEPATVAGWGVLMAGAAWGLRRSRRGAVQV